MKRIMAVILAAVMVFSMTACGEKTYTLDDLAVRDIESGKLIRIGDSREEVEKIVGEPKETKDNGNEEILCEYPSDIDITYNKDGEIIDMLCSGYDFEEEEKKYELAEGVGFGQTEEDFFNAYPGAEDSLDNADILMVKKDKGSKKYKLHTEVLDDSEATDSIAISVSYNSDLKIEAFIISEY